jgi:hypothetical protein
MRSVTLRLYFFEIELYENLDHLAYILTHPFLLYAKKELYYYFFLSDQSPSSITNSNLLSMSLHLSALELDDTHIVGLHQPFCSSLDLSRFLFFPPLSALNYY